MRRNGALACIVQGRSALARAQQIERRADLATLPFLKGAYHQFPGIAAGPPCSGSLPLDKAIISEPRQCFIERLFAQLQSLANLRGSGRPRYQIEISVNAASFGRSEERRVGKEG